VRSFLDSALEFVKLTAIDFKDCFGEYPNVIIWMCVVSLIALFV